MISRPLVRVPIASTVAVVTPSGGWCSASGGGPSLLMRDRWARSGRSGARPACSARSAAGRCWGRRPGRGWALAVSWSCVRGTRSGRVPTSSEGVPARHVDDSGREEDQQVRRDPVPTMGSGRQPARRAGRGPDLPAGVEEGRPGQQRRPADAAPVGVPALEGPRRRPGAGRDLLRGPGAHQPRRRPGVRALDRRVAGQVKRADMTRFGYTLMTEQSGPRELVGYAVDAERVGFDFEVMSDHYSPWLTEQGHAPYAWATLGAVAQATSTVVLMTYVTCPTLRYHPAVVAQKAATLSLLSEGRFTLGLGSGENLNEHVVGTGWPALATRQKMLQEAVQIIRELSTGELVDYEGQFFEVDSARLWDVPEDGLELAVAVAGSRAI